MKNIVFFFFLFFYSFGTFSQQIARGIPNSILFVGGYAKPKTKMQVNHHTFSGIFVSNVKDTLRGEFKFINQEAVLWKPVGEDEFKELSLKNAYYIKLEGTDKTLIKEQQNTDFLSLKIYPSTIYCEKLAQTQG